MAKEVGKDRLGDLYTNGKVRKRREWRGFADTMYDYWRWLHIMGILAGFIIKPRNIKAMLRYRWMANYLAVPMMLDRHTQGLRGEYLRICHTEQDLVVSDVAKLLNNLFRGDRRIGNDTEFSKKVVLVDENEMTAVMMGFPTLKGLSRETPSTYVSVLLNQNAAVYGDAAVAAMSIVSRICMFVLSVMLGIGQGFQPVAGFNYGAGKYSRVKQAFRFTFLLGEISMSVLALLGFAFAPQLVQLFRDDPQVVLIGGFALRCQCVALALQPLNVCSNMLFQSIGKSKPATFLSCTRQGLFFIPAILVLPRVIGLTGVQITQPLADILSFVVSVPLLLRFFRQLPRDEAEPFEKL